MVLAEVAGGGGGTGFVDEVDFLHEGKSRENRGGDGAGEGGDVGCRVKRS